MGLLGTSLTQPKPKGRSTHGHQLTAALPSGLLLGLPVGHHVPSPNIFLAAGPDTDLSHITGHLHQRDETRDLDVWNQWR